MSRATMIEDYIPVEQISHESSREKVARRREGQISTMHLWWARRLTLPQIDGPLGVQVAGFAAVAR